MFQKAALGGIVVLGVALAFLLRGVGLDIGTSGDSGDTATEPGAEQMSPDVMADLADDNNQLVPIKPKTDSSATQLPDTSDLLTVIVEDRHYLWGTNTSSVMPVKKIELAEIVAKAKQTNGNPQGIRVRIYHVGSALPSAETALMTALKDAGLSDTEIFFEQGVIELPEN